MFKPGDVVSVPMYGGRWPAVVTHITDNNIHVIVPQRVMFNKDIIHNEKGDWMVSQTNPIKNPNRIRDKLIRDEIIRLSKRYREEV